MTDQSLKRKRALFGLGLAIGMAAVLLAATLGSLSAVQPVYAHAASRLEQRAAQRLAPAADTLSVSVLAHTGSGDNAVVFNGQQITYTILITNNSTSNAASNISVFDILPIATLDEISCINPCEPIFI